MSRGRGPCEARARRHPVETSRTQARAAPPAGRGRLPRARAGPCRPCPRGRLHRWSCDARDGRGGARSAPSAAIRSRPRHRSASSSFDRHEDGLFALEKETQARHPDVRLEPSWVRSSARTSSTPFLAVPANRGPRRPSTSRWPSGPPRGRPQQRTRYAQRRARGDRPPPRSSYSSPPTRQRADECHGRHQARRDGGAGRPERLLPLRRGAIRQPTGSNGSLVPIFREQIARGGSVTVTQHPEVARYFMTIPEAVQLMLQAAGRVTVARSSSSRWARPCASPTSRARCRLSGFEPDEEVEIGVHRSLDRREAPRGVGLRRRGSGADTPRPHPCASPAPTGRRTPTAGYSSSLIGTQRSSRPAPSIFTP